MITRRDVTFNESSFLQSSEAKQYGETLEVLFPTDAPETTKEAEIQQSDNAIQDQQVCRSGRAHDKPDRSGNWVPLASTLYNVCEVPEPMTRDKALSDPHAKEWEEAADSEYHQSLLENDTWNLVEHPEVREAI